MVTETLFDVRATRELRPPHTVRSPLPGFEKVEDNLAALRILDNEAQQQEQAVSHPGGVDGDKRSFCCPLERVGTKRGRFFRSNLGNALLSACYHV